MIIDIALDAPRTRDLQFYRGDEVTIDLLVYEHDGDEEPIDALRITNAHFVYPRGVGITIPVGSQFTVSDEYGCVRVPYRLVADIDGTTTTLAAGYIVTQPQFGASWGWFSDYGWMWPWPG